jgi:DNA-binding GntR family transcriptional regulator
MHTVLPIKLSTIFSPAYPMEKTNKIGLKYKIVKELRDEIISGKILPGERLKETRLTDKFNCSRGPIREALNQLEKEGFLRLYPNQGAMVTRMSAKDIEDFYTLLELLEGKAVEWAAPRLETKDIKQLKAINKEIRQISRKGRSCIEEWIPLNLEFHRLFREKCENEKLNWLIEEIRMRITRYRYTSLVASAFGKYIVDHNKIIERVEKGDASGAGKAMQAHIVRAKEILIDYLAWLPGL